MRGWDEFELEVVRDRADNVVIVCSIENLDPMGVHTGDSVTVAPQMTLSDEAYQELRDAAAAVIRAVGVDTGGSNIQFARDRETGELRVIEMNPRVSRSSALASKATGYPIAKVAAKLAVGYTLDEIPNDLTGHDAGELRADARLRRRQVPALRVREVPGRRPHARHADEVGRRVDGHRPHLRRGVPEGDALRELDPGAATPWQTLADVPETSTRSSRGDRSHPAALFDVGRLEHSSRRLLGMKRLGISDADIAAAPRPRRPSAPPSRCGIRLVYRRVDSCAGEVEARSNYFYSTWGEADEAPPSGPGRASSSSAPARTGSARGSSSTTAASTPPRPSARSGYEAVMVNCNPETVSTDYDTSDRLYFEPLDKESCSRSASASSPVGVVHPVRRPDAAQARPRDRGAPATASSARRTTRSTSPRTASASRGLLRAHGLRCPQWGIADSPDEAAADRGRIGYPVLVRPSYVLGGRAMRVCYDAATSRRAMCRPRGKVLVDRFLENAIEVDVDALCDGARDLRRRRDAARRGGGRPLGRLGLRPARAGSRRPTARSASSCAASARALGVVGLLNVQLAISDGEVYVLEVEPARLADGAVRLARRSASTSSTPRAGSPPGDRIADLGLPPERCPRHRASRRRCCRSRASPARPGARARDALDRRGDGERGRPADRVREGRARRRAPAAAPAGARSSRSATATSAAVLDRARTLLGLGFELVATGGHGRALERRRLDRAGPQASSKGDASRRPDLSAAARCRPRRQHARGPQRPLRRLRDPRGGALARVPCITTLSGARGGRARDRERARRAGASRSRSGSMPRREPRRVVGVEAVGPYTLLRLERGGARPRRARPVLHARGARPACCRGRSRSASRRAGELGVPDRPDRPGHARRSARSSRGDEIARLRPARQRLPARRRRGRCSSAAGSGSRRCPYLAEALDRAAGRARLPQRASRRGGRARSRTPRS